MATKIQTPLSKAAASGKISKGAVVDTKKKTSTPASGKPKVPPYKTTGVPAKKTPVKKQLVEVVEGNDIVVKEVPVKKTKEPKERKETAKGLIAAMIVGQKHTDDEIAAEVGAKFPDTFKKAYISATRGSMNRGDVYQKLAEGKLPLNPVYKNEAGKIVAEKPSKAKTEEKKQPVKKAAISLLKKTKDSLPTE